MARQITEAGGQVAHLYLIEAYGEGSFDEGTSRLIAIARNVAEMNTARLCTILSEKTHWLFERASGRRTGAEEAPDTEGASDLVRRLTASQLKAGKEYLSYQRAAWKGTASIFVSDIPPLSAPSSPYFGWRRLISGALAVYRVPGNHYTILAPPNLQNLLALCAEANRE